MYVKKKKNRSQTTSVVVCEKIKGKYKEHIIIGVSSDENEIENYVRQGRKTHTIGIRCFVRQKQSPLCKSGCL